MAFTRGVSYAVLCYFGNSLTAQIMEPESSGMASSPVLSFAFIGPGYRRCLRCQIPRSLRGLGPHARHVF